MVIAPMFCSSPESEPFNSSESDIVHSYRVVQKCVCVCGLSWRKTGDEKRASSLFLSADECTELSVSVVIIFVFVVNVSCRHSCISYEGNLIKCNAFTIDDSLHHTLNVSLSLSREESFTSLNVVNSTTRKISFFLLY